MEADSHHLLLETIVAAIFLGILAQVVAERFRLPAIVPLLIFGMASGPFALGILHPGALGHGLEVFIHLGVAIILFEGGLSLDPRQLRQVGAAVRNLLTLGVVVTGVGSAWLARVATGMSWETAALFGAIVTVTGPTVIVPLLRHMIAPQKVRTVLVSEGLIVDPIGAVLAYLVLQWIDRAGLGVEAIAGQLFELSLTGAILGFVAGALARGVTKTRLLGGELRNLAILALLLGCYLIAEARAPQSGILAAVVMGFTMSAADLPDLASVKVFKGQLTVLLISVLFILLSAQLDLGAVVDLGWRGLVVAVGMVLVIRPLSVLVSVWPSHMDARSRAVLALTAPRGIVAAAVASLSAIQLRAAGLDEGAAVLEGLIYLVIVFTGVWATVMALVLPKALGFANDPSRRLTVLVGANPLSKALAGLLGDRGRKVVVVDSAAAKLRRLRAEGIQTQRGDARDASTYEKAGVERDTQLLALTTNDELNVLVGLLVHDEFGIEHPILVMQQPSDEFGRLRRAWMDQLGGGAVQADRWMRLLEAGKAELVTLPARADDLGEELSELLDDTRRHCVLICGWKEGLPSFRARVGGLDSCDEVTMLASGEALQRLRAVQAEATESAADASAAVEEEPSDGQLEGSPA